MQLYSCITYQNFVTKCFTGETEKQQMRGTEKQQKGGTEKQQMTKQKKKKPNANAFLALMKASAETRQRIFN